MDALTKRMFSIHSKQGRWAEQTKSAWTGGEEQAEAQRNIGDPIVMIVPLERRGRSILTTEFGDQAGQSARINEQNDRVRIGV